MFDLLAWWRARRKPLPPGTLTDLITKLDADKTPLNQRAATLKQYALYQLGKDGRNKTNG
jgi:hypothetical protein